MDDRYATVLLGGACARQPSAPHRKKELLLNAFVMTTPGHLSAGQWNHPRNDTANYNKLSFWTSLAQKLDSAGFHCMFIADTLGAYDVYRGPGNVGPALRSGAQYPVNDPLCAVPAMAAATKRIVFGVTMSTTYEAPYALARRLSTVDHLTEGRLAWNIVTSYLDSAARNFGLAKQSESAERYRFAEEYMDVVYKLWEASWEDDAVIRDFEKGIFAVAGKVHDIKHHGENFTVPGPHICEPSPQRTPFLFQAGTSKAGIKFAARHAEAVFVNGESREKVRATVASIRENAGILGRDPNHIKLIAGITIIVDRTDEGAKRKRDEFLTYGDQEGALTLLGGWTGIDLSLYSDDEDFRYGVFPMLVGGPETVADELERWVEEVDVDGFNLAHVVIPGSFDDIIQFLLPELKRRGLFGVNSMSNKGVTAREVFGLGQPRVLADHPAFKVRRTRNT